MATITRTYQVDDLDGSEEDVDTVQFTVDRVAYEIDLSAANAERLREKLAKYIDAGTRVMPQRTRKAGRGSPSTPPISGADQVRAVREWAAQNGYQVSKRGRISKTIQDAFDAAH